MASVMLKAPAVLRILRLRLLLACLIFVALAKPARGSARIPCSWSSGILLARLHESETCRAAFRGSFGTLCVPAELWARWLESPQPQVWCGEIPGKWKVFSPLENRFGTKRIERVFLASGSPVGARRESWTQTIERTREQISERLRPGDPLGLWRSLLLDERSREWPVDLFRLLGFIHLFAASGIHLYAISSLWSALLRRAGAQTGLPVGAVQAMARVLVGTSWLWAWILSGARRGLLRPWILVLLRRSALALGFRWKPWAPLALSLALDASVGWIQGESLLQGTRLFYALAVGGGLMILGSSSERKPTISHLLLSLSSWIFAAFWEVGTTGMVALATPLLSALTLPLFCVFLYPGFLLSSGIHFLGVSAPSLIRIAEDIALPASEGSLIRIASWVMRWDSLWSLPPRWLILSLVCTIAATALGLLEGPRRKLLLIMGLLALRLAIEPGLSHSEVLASGLKSYEVIQLDVGQGDSALVAQKEGAAHAGLIDAGSIRSLSETQWIETLAHFGVQRLDWVALTHLDEDHSGGLKRLARIISIGCVATSHELWDSPRGAALARELTGLGVPTRDWNGDCVPLPVKPPSFQEKKGRLKANGFMSALLVPLASGGYYLSAGDADARDEAPIARWAKHEIQRREGTSPRPGLRILKVSHHGSKTSSSPEMLRVFDPDLAIVSSGVGNPYGHPNAEVLTRFQRAGIPVLRTDERGAIRAAGARRPRPEHHP